MADAFDYEITLQDRIHTVQVVDSQHDLRKNAYVSISGGLDSTITHHLIDEALPNNRIPRVFIDTGIEYNEIKKFVYELAANDDRFIIIKPSKPIKQVLEKYGYPFKSKQHSHNIAIFQRNTDRTLEMFNYINNNKELLKDYDFIHDLPDGLKTNVKYFFGIRERERVVPLRKLSLTHLNINLVKTLKYHYPINVAIS